MDEKRYRKQNLRIEHPRASSTNDIECFFSVLRSMVGNHFTCKAVMVKMRKTCNEFSKRIDKDLPFYYYTSTNERFHEGERPDFNKFAKPTKNPRHQRVRAREQPANLAVGRATYIQTGSKSIRRKFHNVEIELPPPPESSSQVNIQAEHSYA